MRKSACVCAVLPFPRSFAASSDDALVVRALAAVALSLPAKIADVGFLSGHWIGTWPGGCAEEIMAGPLTVRSSA